MKNLKKGLAVAMSLAMIATVVPTMKVDAADLNGACGTTGDAKDDHYANLDVLDELAALDLNEANNLTQVKLGELDKKSLSELVVLAGYVADSDANTTTYAEALTYFTDDRKGNAWQCASTDAEYLANKKKAQAIADTMDLFGDAGAIKTKLATLTATTAIGQATSGATLTKADAEALITFFEDNADHLTSAEQSKADANSARVKKLIAAASKIDAASVEEKLKTILEDNTGITYANLDTASIYDIKGLEKAVDAIDDYMADEGKAFAREANVKAVIKAINEKLAALEEAANSSTALEDLELPEKFVQTGNAGVNYINWNGQKSAAEITLPSAANADEIAKIIDEMDSEDYKTLKAFDKVFLKSWTPVLEKPTSREPYELFIDQADVKADAEGYMLTFANTYYTPVMKDGKATGDFVKDLIEERMDEVETAYNLVMKASALTSKVDDAIYELIDEDGTYTDNLTKAEFSNVFVKAASLGKEVGKVGWVDLGNGNWDFFNEDGTKSTKWVAAGKLWYFVKDGHMLRNSWVAQDSTGNVWYYVNDKGEMVVSTTVDGYTINANGEWHKK